jgi:FixJ family two-component response regulator
MKTHTQPMTRDSDALLLAARCARGRVVVIDDDAEVLGALAALFDLEGLACETHASASAYLTLRAYNQPLYPGPYCVLSDVQMPGLGGLALQSRLAAIDDTPLLFMSGASGVQEAVQAFQGGAQDFLLKPLDADVVLAAVTRALALSAQRQAQRERKAEIALRMATLTARERTVAHCVAQGQINDVIANDLGIALRTVKLHRQHAMAKLQVHTVVDLARIADEAGL